MGKFLKVQVSLPVVATLLQAPLSVGNQVLFYFKIFKLNMDGDTITQACL